MLFLLGSHMLTMSVCSSFEKEVYDEWTAGVDEACSFNLQQPLLTRNKETKLIAVNFDPQVYMISSVVHSHKTGSGLVQPDLE